MAGFPESDKTESDKLQVQSTLFITNSMGVACFVHNSGNIKQCTMFGDIKLIIIRFPQQWMLDKCEATVCFLYTPTVRLYCGCHT